MNFQRISTWLIWGIYGFLLVLPFFIFRSSSFHFGDAWPSEEVSGGISLLGAGTSWAAVFFWIIGECLNWAPFLLSLWIIRSILIRYQAGSVFNSKTVSLFRALSVVLLIDGFCCSILKNTFFRLAETIDLGVGNRLFMISLGSDSLGSIFAGLLVLLLAFIMAEATRLAEEQSLTI